MTEKRMTVYDTIQDDKYFEGAYTRAAEALEDLEKAINDIQKRAKHLNPEDRIYPRCLELLEESQLINHLIDGHMMQELNTICFTIQETTKEIYGSYYLPNWNNTMTEQEGEYMKMLAIYLEEQ